MSFKKIIPYVLLVFSAVIITHIIDKNNEPEPVSIDLKSELEPYIRVINEQNIIIETYEKKIEIEDSIQNEFEIRHNNIIHDIRNSTPEQFDILSANLINRLINREPKRHNN